jgi:hypothetical protein
MANVFYRFWHDELSKEHLKSVPLLSMEKIKNSYFKNEGAENFKNSYFSPVSRQEL